MTASCDHNVLQFFQDCIISLHFFLDSKWPIHKSMISMENIASQKRLAHLQGNVTSSYTVHINIDIAIQQFFGEWTANLYRHLNFYQCMYNHNIHSWISPKTYQIYFIGIFELIYFLFSILSCRKSLRQIKNRKSVQKNKFRNVCLTRLKKRGI